MYLFQFWNFLSFLSVSVSVNSVSLLLILKGMLLGPDVHYQAHFTQSDHKEFNQSYSSSACKLLLCWGQNYCLTPLSVCRWNCWTCTSNGPRRRTAIAAVPQTSPLTVNGSSLCLETQWMEPHRGGFPGRGPPCHYLACTALFLLSHYLNPPFRIIRM